jgi:hypothetical protein
VADRKRRAGSKASDSADKKATEARQRAEHDVGLLDSPDVADEPSELRHVYYFVGVMVLAVVLNLLAMIAVAGGQ